MCQNESLCFAGNSAGESESVVIKEGTFWGGKCPGCMQIICFE